MRKLRKIDAGWYESKDGTIFQKWEMSIGAPKRKAGWYIWLKFDDRENPRGPFKTLREAVKSVNYGG